MLVKHLIEQLLRQDQNKPVYTSDLESEVDEVYEATLFIEEGKEKIRVPIVVIN